MKIGCRIPLEFFVTKGNGQSDISIHAGSYHIAMCNAGIAECNLMYYSSILPAQSYKIKQPDKLHHGSVMETIVSSHTSECGTIATAGISYGWLYEKNTGIRHGGIVCEQSGAYDTDKLESLLKTGLLEIYESQFTNYDLNNIEVICESFVPTKKYGTALVALCFTSYEYPIIE